jgi:hypothetical protein
LEIEKCLSVNELRVGNLVDWERTTHIVRGLQRPAEGKNYGLIYSNWHKALEEEPYIEPDHYHQGIWLDHKWFELLGFKHNKELNIYVRGKIDLEQIWTGSREWSVHVFENELDMGVEYVHELQNLIFILEGKDAEFDINDI